MSSTPVQMRELHEAVVRVITELNNECYNALTSVRAKQVCYVPSFLGAGAKLFKLAIHNCSQYSFHLGIYGFLWFIFFDGF